MPPPRPARVSTLSEHLTFGLEPKSLAGLTVGALCIRLLFASAPLREAVQQPSNAAAAATAPQAIVDGLRRAAGDAAAAPKGAHLG